MSQPFLDLLARSQSLIECVDQSFPVGDLVEQGRRLAEQWAAVGLQPGDRVGLWLANGSRYLAALAGCAAGGFVAVSVNTRWSRAEADSLLHRSGACLLRTADAETLIGTATTVEPSDHDGFVVFTTSGTTSRPKMVLHRQQSVVDHAHDAGRAFGYSPDTPVLVAMPLCGVFGLVSFTAAVAADAPVIMAPVIDPVDIAATVERRGVVAVNGSDDLFHRMLATNADLSSIAVGGYARFNTSLDGIVARAEARGMNLTGLYGMSEVQALFSLRDPTAEAAVRERPGGTLVSPAAGARVVDDELQLRGPSLFAGYLAEGGASIDQKLTAAHITADGWFRTGDAAAMDKPVGGRATFTYRARMGDALRLGGFLVAPSEIEAVLIGFPGVDAAQVVAVDLPTGARPVAFVTGSLSVPGGDAAAAEAAVIEYCATRLARYKVPVRVIVVDEFPTTPSANGTKIQKARLRELAARALGSD